MLPSRRWLLLPFVAVCAFLLSGTAVSQDPTPTGGKETKQKEKAQPDGSDVADLKKALAVTQKELEANKKALDDLKTATAAAAKTADTAKAAAEQARTGVDAAAKQFATKDDLAALPKPGAG